jgi:predicted ATP-binding protein involved in virulence
MLIPTLNTSDRTRTAWATARQIGTRLAGLNPNLHLH